MLLYQRAHGPQQSVAVPSTHRKQPTIQHGHQQTWGQVRFTFAKHTLVPFCRFRTATRRSDDEGPPADLGPGKSTSLLSLYSHSFCLFCRFRKFGQGKFLVCVCVSLRASSSHGSVHVHPCVFSLCRRARRSMVSSMSWYAFASCVVVLVLVPWFRPCLCVCLRASSSNGSVHVHPCVGLCVYIFVLVLVPWFRPCLRASSSHGSVHVHPCVCPLCRRARPSMVSSMSMCVIFVLVLVHGQVSTVTPAATFFV